jgi:hypothetical protein
VSAPIPAWEDLELRHREQGGELELILLWEGEIQGCARARIRDAFVVSPPSGSSWAIPLLEEALEEWRQAREPRRVHHAV